MHFGQQILQFRKAMGLSQEELAEKLDVSRQSVTKWEADLSVPELSKIVALADLFEVSVDKLLGREKNLYDVVYTKVAELSSQCTRDDDANIALIIRRYMEYMKSAGMSPETIIEGLSFMCDDGEESDKA